MKSKASNQNLNIQEVLNKTIASQIEIFEAQILLAHVLKVNSAYLIAFPEKKISSMQYSHFMKMVTRRLEGEPIAYILKEKEFWSESFEINSSTLIPRPETELLIETVLEHFPNKQHLRILELGTGSGIISIILAKLYPYSDILAIDISKDALKIAKKNQKKHGVKNVKFLKSDWFKNINKKNKTNFDLIISNPPYLTQNDVHLKEGDLRYEPKIALVAGKTGLESIFLILSEAKHYLKKNGILMIEHGYDQDQKVKEFFLRNGFTATQLKTDLSCLPRVTMGKLSGIK